MNAVPSALLNAFYKAIFLLSLIRNCGGNIVLFFFSGQPAQPLIAVNTENSSILFHWLLGLAPSNLGLQELASQVGSINYPLALMKTLKIVSLFIFRHWKHYFWSTQNREK